MIRRKEVKRAFPSISKHYGIFPGYHRQDVRKNLLKQDCQVPKAQQGDKYIQAHQQHSKYISRLNFR
jgi:hypothetical protein